MQADSEVAGTRAIASSEAGAETRIPRSKEEDEDERKIDEKNAENDKIEA